MKTVNYYIEDLATGLVVMADGSMKQYSNDVDPKAYSSYDSAFEGIDLLPAGEYRIFSRIVKA